MTSIQVTFFYSVKSYLGFSYFNVLKIFILSMIMGLIPPVLMSVGFLGHKLKKPLVDITYKLY